MMEEKHVKVSNLTLSLWLDYVRPALGKDTAPANVADEIEHCMTIACFNAHYRDRYASRAEAIQLLYQLTVSVAYRPETRDAMIDLSANLTSALQDETITQ